MSHGRRASLGGLEQTARLQNWPQNKDPAEERVGKNQEPCVCGDNSVFSESTSVETAEGRAPPVCAAELSVVERHLIMQGRPLSPGADTFNYGGV